MKKAISMAVLAALVAGCTLTDTGNTTNAGYGTEGLGEEALIGGAGPTLTDTYLMAAAPKYYVGNAYKVDDVQYVPMEDFTYNQTGVAGIIPVELNGTRTSNGEIFDSNQLLAASKTLPLPTIVRVTNLDNGESVIVRVNNRGPFVNSRIIDLSSAAASKLGISSQAKVQVQVLPNESRMVKAATLGTAQPTDFTPTPVAEPAPIEQPQPTPVAASGDYTVQIAALYSEDSATALANKMKTYGNAVVVKEGDLYKVRIVNLDAASARNVIDTLRSNEGMAPGLLQNGRWINADSI